eukprot:gnl/TRDRNA2_/TRDRNA2_177049_c1_seq1.p1 gnl/TRDRNA2_/TRDRNA2_177049_c1~~gnl/TRDRNA2_/TRDRNA2_177049_c1_seq1.p1  ORF type:complete len:560 (+),score=65.06 gnl/TRDRNA2_/TRDRNA2_177049_c1_seq1:92-1771(+)
MSMASAASDAQRLRTVLVEGKTKTFSTNVRYTVPETWEPLRPLGSGAYATVAAFRCKGHDFAVKKFPRVFDHPVFAVRVLREVRLLAHLRHPNILAMRELFVDGPNFRDAYLCLELMDGDLNQLIHGGKERLTDYQVQCISYKVLCGLLCLHTARIIHRDLKPGNILVKSDGAVKIADLGLARSIDAGVAQDSRDMAVLTEYVVTRYYRAPEVVLTATQYTFAVDIWSMGCIIGEMLTRQLLFEGKDSLDQIRRIVRVVGTPTAKDLDWIPASSPSRKFLERCEDPSNGEAFGRLLRWPGSNPQVLDLLPHMLRFNPSRRISVDQSLDHQYFQSFGARGDPLVKAACAVSPVDWSFDRNLHVDASGQSKPFNEQTFRAEFHEVARLVLEREGSVTPIPAAADGSGSRRAGPGNSGTAASGIAGPDSEHEAEYETQSQPRPAPLPRDDVKGQGNGERKRGTGSERKRGRGRATGKGTDVSTICLAECLALEQPIAADGGRLRHANESARQLPRPGSSSYPSLVAAPIAALDGPSQRRRHGASATAVKKQLYEQEQQRYYF